MTTMYMTAAEQIAYRANATMSATEILTIIIAVLCVMAVAMMVTNK